MKRLVLTIALVLMVCAVIAHAQDPQSSLYMPKTRHDFGKVFEQEAYTYSFVVRNRGNADLIIDNVKPG